MQRPAGIKRPERKFRRLRLYLFQLIYEVAGPRYALLCFATHVEARSPPEARIEPRLRTKFHVEAGLYAYLLAARMIRPFSRSQSRCFSDSRLSYCFLPLASPICTLTRPRV